MRSTGAIRWGLRAAKCAGVWSCLLNVIDIFTDYFEEKAILALKDKVLRAPGEGTTVILTSHIMSEIEELAEDLVFLVEGNVIYQGPVASLLARSGELRLERAIAAILAEASA